VIVSQFHGDDAASDAESRFVSVFSKGEQPEDVTEVALAFNGEVVTADLSVLLTTSGAVASRSEARRLITQGAVEVDGVKVGDSKAQVRAGALIRVGKHRFLRVVDADG